MSDNRKEVFELVPNDSLKYRSPNLDIDAKVFQHVIVTIEFVIDDLKCSCDE